MYLFSRVLSMHGSPRQTMPWVKQVTEYVNANSSLDVTAWSADFGAPIGTVGWSTLIESQAELAASVAGLLADPAYFDLIESAADLVAAPGQDHLREIIHGEPSDPPPLGAVAITTTAAAMVDRMADAVSWSVEIAQHVEAVTGSPVAVLLDSFGPVGTITWIGVAEDIAATDANAAKMRGDADYVGKLAASEGLFVPGSSNRVQLTRIA